MGHAHGTPKKSEVRVFKATERSAHFIDFVENFDLSKGCVAADACVQQRAGIALSKEPQERKKQLISVYTGNALYREMNACLNMDDLVEMRKYSGYIRELRETFRTDDPDPVVHPYRGMLHRGIYVDDPAAYVKQFFKGEEFLWASFTSTSKSRSAAFSGRVRFEIQCSLGIDGRKAEYAPASVKHLSRYASEDEVLFPPHVTFRVVNIKGTTVMLETVEFPSVWELISKGDWAAFAKWAAPNAARVDTGECAFSVINAVTVELVQGQLAADPITAGDPPVDPLLVCLGCHADINEVDPETGATPVLTIAKAAAQAASQAIAASVQLAEKLQWCIGVGGNIFLKNKQGEAAVDVYPAALQLAQQVDGAGFRWEYFVDDGVDGKECGWYPYAADACPLISTLYDAWLCDQSLSAQEVRSKGDSGTNFHYALCFASMEQRNVSTGKVRKIRRMALQV